MLNLQLFADEKNKDEKDVDEKDVDEKIKGEEEKEIEKEEELEIETEEEIDIAELEDEDDPDEDKDPDQEKKPADKKEAAIIKYKREKKDAQKRISELEKILEEKNKESAIEEKSKELIEKGYDKKDADRLAILEFENQNLRKTVLNRSFKDLEVDYPGILEHKEEITKLMNKYEGMKPQEIYLAKFADTNIYENKTKLEQQLLHQQKISKEKSGAGSGNVENEVRTKITATEKRQYLAAKKFNKDLTIQRFLELDNDNSEILEE